jgi:hypothetical protein
MTKMTPKPTYVLLSAGAPFLAVTVSDLEVSANLDQLASKHSTI